jgi:hypothetical protein
MKAAPTIAAITHSERTADGKGSAGKGMSSIGPYYSL